MAAVDALEPRRLLASNFDSGVLTVDGTGGNDDIRVSLSGNQVVVELNGASDGSFDVDPIVAIRVNGADGDDLIQIGSGLIGARLDGGEGNDTLLGGSGADALFGRGGNDSLAGGAGNDALNGGVGEDVLQGDGGVDTATYADRTEDLTVTMDGGSNDGAGGGAEGDDVRNDVENFVGGSGNDSVKGNDSDNVIEGREGNDTLIGNRGNDTLDGGDGNDTVDGKENADVLIGGLGFDAADYRFETANLVLTIDGVANEAGGGAAGDNIALDIERIVGGTGDDSITGSSGDNSLDGRGGNDTVVGGAGNDSLDGNTGNDSLVGNEGNDVLTGGSGNDTHSGGDGDDAFIANDGEADTIGGGAGNDNAIADQPGDTITGVETGITLPAPEVTVTVGGNGVTDGVTTVNFGSANQGAAGAVRTFTVRNDGDDVLSLGAVSVPAGFVLVEGLAGSLAPGASDTFTVQVDTSVAGAKSGVVSFANSDPDENPFDIAVTASVAVPPPQIPDITVRIGGTGIADGQAAAINFGAVDQGATGPTRTFTVVNDGTGVLNIGSVAVPAGFSIVDPLQGPIGPGGSESFTVRLDTASAGAKGGEVVITTNDPDEDPFNFAIAGTVSAPPPPARPDIDVTIKNPAGRVDNGNSTIDFGNREVGARGPTRTFRIFNVGDQALALGAITLPEGFAFAAQPNKTTLAPGDGTSFTVRMTTGDAGRLDGFVSIANNDPDEGPFRFRVLGNVVTTGTGPIPEVTFNMIRSRQLRGVSDGSSSFDMGSPLVSAKLPTAGRRFRIANDGSAPLILKRASISRGFLLLDGPVRRLNPGQTDFITIAVDPRVAGRKSGIFSVQTNDADENPFTFGLTANVVTAVAGGQPEVSVVTTKGQAIIDGSSAAVGFGTVQRSSAGVTRTFRVHNTGNAPLTVGAVSVPGGFSVVDPLVGPIAAGSAESFTIRLDTGSAGNKGGRVSFGTNDSNENPFDFAISGAVSDPAPPSGSLVRGSVSGGTLTIDGTASVDTITVTGGGGGIAVTGNGRRVSGSPFNGVRRIVVNAGDGADRVDLTDVSLPTTVNGGNGNDTVVGGTGDDRINGQGGFDVLDGFAGDDALFGGSDDDVLTGGPGVDVLHGEDGDDTVNATDGLADATVDGGPGNDVIRKDRVDSATGT